MRLYLIESAATTAAELLTAWLLSTNAQLPAPARLLGVFALGEPTFLIYTSHSRIKQKRSNGPSQLKLR